METKHWYQSLTIWGTAILGVATLALPLLGQADLAAFIQEEQAGIVDWLALVGGAIGGVLALIGRWRARGPIE